MTDAELAAYLGIDGTPGWENVIATLTQKQRAVFDRMTKLPAHTCPTCQRSFRGADERFCPDCHAEAQAHGPLGASS
jgi:predicted amidophosphoribosyltransferase